MSNEKPPADLIKVCCSTLFTTECNSLCTKTPLYRCECCLLVILFSLSTDDAARYKFCGRIFARQF